MQAGDVESVAASIREADRVEVFEACGRDVATVLRKSVRHSTRTATLRVGADPVAVFGVGSLSAVSTVGVPWMLGAKDITQHAKVLLPYGPDVVRKMMQGHTVLRNMVHVDNKASIRWLKSLGFAVHDPEPLGWRGALFHVFELKKGEVHV